MSGPLDSDGEARPGPADAAPSPAEDALVRVGERFGGTVRFSRDEIVRFAHLAHDHNPMHHDEAAAAASRFGGLIASGTQAIAVMMGMFATHFTRRDDGVERAALGIEFDMRLPAPVRPDEDVRIDWEVMQREWKPRHRGWVVTARGTARTTARTGHEVVAIDMRGVGLVMPADRI